MATASPLFQSALCLRAPSRSRWPAPSAGMGASAGLGAQIVRADGSRERCRCFQARPSRDAGTMLWGDESLGHPGKARSCNGDQDFPDRPLNRLQQQAFEVIQPVAGASIARACVMRSLPVIEGHLEFRAGAAGQPDPGPTIPGGGTTAPEKARGQGPTGPPLGKPGCGRIGWGSTKRNASNAC